MQRTPPRRSPRLQNSGLDVPSNSDHMDLGNVAPPSAVSNGSANAAPPSAVSVAETTGSLNSASSSAVLVAATTGSTHAVLPRAVSAIASAVNASTVLNPVTFTNVSTPINATSAAAEQRGAPANDVSTATSYSEIIFDAMQKQIAALENQLRNMQSRLSESDLQCQTLKEAVQNMTTASVSLGSTSNRYEIASLFPSVTTTVTRPPYTSVSPANGPIISSRTSPPGYFPNNFTNIQPATSSSSIYTAMPVTGYGYTNVSVGEMHHTRAGSLPCDYRTATGNPPPQPPPSSSVDTAIYMQSNRNSMVPRKLQDLPSFSGHPEEWPVFYTTYVQSTAAYNYTNLENNQRLNKCLGGEARETVKSLLIHPDNVSAIIDQLHFRFGRPEQLIRCQLNHVREIAPITENAVMRLIPFATKTKNLSVFLQSVNGQQHLANPTLLEELVSKLPMSKRLEWARCAAQIRPYPTIVHFSDWLSDLAQLICSVQDSECRQTKRRMTVLHTEGKPRSYDLKCPLCQGQHKPIDCKQIIDATVPERWSKVKDLRLCFTCLRTGHSTRNCNNKSSCPVNGCQRRHHRLLHEFTIMEPDPRHQKSRAEDGREAVASCVSRNVLAVREVASSDLLFRVLPVTLYGQRKSIDTYALLDEGSSLTMLDDALVKELGLRGQQQQLSIQWVGGIEAKESTVVVDLYVSGTGLRKRHRLSNVYGVPNLNLPTQSLSKWDLGSDTSHLKKLSMQPYTNAEPKLLIGLDHCHLGLPTDFLQINQTGPYAAHTELGWVVFGPTKKINRTTPSCLLTTTSNGALHSLVAEYFETENFGVKASPPIESKADSRARDILQSTTERVKGRYQTGLLWESDDVQLPDSYAMALKRLIGIERKMKRDVNFAAAYSSIIKAYVNKGYARKLKPTEAAITGAKTWYLPHFAVVNPNKPGKLRLVFDAAAEVNGVSLNSHLMKGPQHYQSLPSVLFHFREGAVAVCGDIREMFHQILIQPEDRCAQRFLWRDADCGRPPDVYEMMVMTFGAACSPCSAQYVKTINALRYQEHHPRATKAITDHHYVDDFIDSFESAEQAVEVSSLVREIHKNAGFELRNFTSNSPDVVNALEGSEAAVSLSARDSFGTEKVLGMCWKPAFDNFSYQLRFHHVGGDIIDGTRCPTKRELLSIVMSVFDPLGFLSHFTIAAKLMMREVWRHHVRWDELLPIEILKPWNGWRKQLPNVCMFNVPRFYFRNGPPEEVQLHVFVDASEDAFAAVAYWRVMNLKQIVETSFVCAKTKCAPLKPLTVPRLELQAAVLGTRLMKTVLEEHSVSVSRHILWSDSITVIKWIRSERRRYKPFVMHRIAEILGTTDSSNWRWLPTHENAADEATRSNTVDFSPTSRWLKGPKFLLEDESNWPAEPAVAVEDDVDVDEELRPKYSLLVVSTKIIDINRFSSFGRLLRTMAWVFRFVSRCRKQPHRYQDHGLTALELGSAEELLCRQAQTEAFATEMKQIGCNQAIDKQSALYKLSPYIDSNGILRVYGRVDAASWLSYATKRPIILPPDHALTTLLLAHYHQKMKHQNAEAVICEIRQKFWVPRLRQVMRKVVSKCCVCKINKVMPITPMMGPLPEDRLTPFVRPFTYTGLDYFGPLTVTIGRRIEKRWVALFTCLVVRAIHLEVAYDLSTDACILAIRNFINRRGTPLRIRSDNGTNFIGASQEATRFSEVFDCERIQGELSSKGVEWMFNCPANPSEGGVWERMVRCVKRVLLHTLKEVSPREYTLQSLIIEAENIVNSRPLTHVPIVADQEEPLTPNHFLLGSASTAHTPSTNDPSEKICALRKQWRIARQLRDRFWKRWVAEYLPTLTRRVKWCQRSKPITKGDLVFICDASLPRREWCRGRIEKVYTGADGQTRRADVRTSRGILQRPASKLAVLDLESGES